jgi:hypothetical protein
MGENMRKRLVVAAVALCMLPLWPQPAAAHGSCSLRIDRAYRDGVLTHHMNGFARYTCTEGHARIAIRVKIQVVAVGGWTTVGIMNNSNKQAKRVAATASVGCFLWHGTGATDNYRTFVEYARVFNQAGHLIAKHTLNDVPGESKSDSCLA